MIFDTDVVIWVFRGHEGAAKLVESTERSRIFSLTDHAFQTLPLTENIGHRASVYMEEYTLKTALYMADALIAATAIEHHVTLCTANRKHYRQINELNLKTFRP